MSRVRGAGRLSIKASAERPSSDPARGTSFKDIAVFWELVLPGVTWPSYDSAPQSSTGPPGAIAAVPTREWPRRGRNSGHGVVPGLELSGQPYYRHVS